MFREKKMKTMKSSTGPRDSRLFPRHSHWIIFLLTVIFRILYVINKDNWWILHPDEIYQTLEAASDRNRPYGNEYQNMLTHSAEESPNKLFAHSELYGFGFRPYEYLPPPDLNDLNITIARKHEYHLGMYSLRSFIIPKIYTYVGYFFLYFGYSGSLFVIWKVFHTVVSSLLILSVYKFTTCMYGCHDTAVLSVFMCACSIHLNILSTHTLINSFLSPIVYLIIADILERSSPRMLTSPTKHNEEKNSANNNYDNYSLCGVKNVNIYNDAQFKQIPDQCETDHNANLHLASQIITSKNDLGTNNSPTNMYLHTIAKNSGGRWSRIIKSVFSGFILGLVVYVRPDTCAVIISVIACTINLKRLKLIFCPFYLIGFILAISIGLRDDYVSYNSVIISPWQWIKFNVGGNLSATLFGVEPTLFYLRRLLLDDWLNFLHLTFSSFLFLLYAVYTVLLPHENSSPKVILKVKMTKQLISIVLCLLCLYSSKGHKEIRFVHDVIPLILILYSKIILVVCEIGFQLCKIKQCMYLILILTAAIQWNTFISLDKSKISQWSYRGIDNSNHVNKCLDFISRQQNVTGVFLDADFHMSGGFSILRHNVSVLALNQKEYFKFGDDARITVNSNFISNGTHSIFTLSRISNFISANNQRYLWKSIIEDSNINYFIVTDRRLLINSTSVEIYTSGNFKVLVRIFDSLTEQALYAMTNTTSLVDNSEILNTEADWLIYYGAYRKARERLTYALKIDERNLRSHQLMIQLYHIKGDNKAARAFLQECRKYHDRKTCLQTPNHDHMK